MPSGGFRANSGRRRADGSPPRPAQPRNGDRRPALQNPRRMTAADYAAIIEASRAAAKKRERRLEWCPYRIEGKTSNFIHPRPAMPKDESLRMAFDQGLIDNTAWAQDQWMQGGLLGAVESEGLFFLGYPLLSEMAQRSEFATISGTVATEMTRKGWRWKGTGQGDEEKRDDGDEAAAERIAKKAKPNGPASRATKVGDDDKGEKIREMRDLERHLELQDRFCDAALYDNLMGRSHLYLETAKTTDEELRMPLIDPAAMGSAEEMKEALKAKVGRGWLRRVANVEAMWVYPLAYNASDPTAVDWYNPQNWYVMGRQFHRSRMPTFVGRPVPDMLKPAYSFGGLSLSQMVKPYVDIWISTRESVADLVRSFATLFLQTDLSTLLTPGGGTTDLIARLAALTVLRDNQGLFVGNKDTEDLKSVSHPIAGLSDLQQQALEHVMIPARIPAVKFTGMQPAGLNASSEGELQVWDESIGAYQTKLFLPKLNYIGWIMQLSLRGEIDDDLVPEFVPLRSLSEKEEAELDKMKAETASVRIGDGIVDQEEERQRLADDPKSPYPDIDPEDVPEPPDEGEGIDPTAAVRAGGVKGGFGAEAGGGRKVVPFRGTGDLALDEALIPLLEEACAHDVLGYLDGLTKVSYGPDRDQWNAGYDPEPDELLIEGKFEGLPAAEQLEVLLHEAGHRGGLKVDRRAFREFKRRDFCELEDFLAIANETHLRDFARRGVVDGLTHELFAQSYAASCLGKPLPPDVAAFWRQRCGGLARDEMPAAAGIAFVTPANKALFLRWAPGHERAGEWAFPGGGLEARERPRDAAMREAGEETGWRLSEDDYVRLLNHNSDHGADYWTFVHLIPNEFQPQLSDEHDAYEWRPLADPPKPLHSGVEHLLRAGYMASGQSNEKGK